MELRSEKIIRSGLRWVPVEISKIRVGDYIRASTLTYSQKWLVRTDHCDLNAAHIGVVVSISDDNIKIKLANGTVRDAFPFVGTSGAHMAERLGTL